MKSFKKIFLLFLFAFTAMLSTTSAQQVKDYTFAGIISLKGGGNYTYKIVFTDSAGTISGQSVTDIGGASETSTAITGKVNRAGKEIGFRETKLLKTKDQGPRDSFCYISARLRLKGDKVLKGNFTGYKSDGKSICGTGDVMLYSTAALMASLMEIGVSADSGTLRIADTAVFNKATGIPAGIVQLSPDTTWEVKGNGKSATLELWDDKYVDGDEVTVLHNGTPLLERYKLAADKKKLNIRLGKEADTITIHAVNEGSEPPNTAMLRFISGSNVQYINATTRPGMPVRIIIRP